METYVRLCRIVVRRARLKPSLVEWKLLAGDLEPVHIGSLETFLGGMETQSPWSIVWCALALETFLGGMETYPQK